MTEILEFKFFPSHSIPVEIQCGINRLEMPASALTEISESEATELFVSAHILSHQSLISLHDAPVRTHFASLDTVRCALAWDYVLSLPVRVKDLPRDACLVFTVWSEKGHMFGTTITRLFDSTGKLKNGKQKLVFFKDGSISKSDMNLLEDNEYERLAANDTPFNLEKKLEAYKMSASSSSDRGNSSSRLDWLDRISLAQVQETLSVLTARTDASGSFFKGLGPDEGFPQLDRDVISWLENDEERILREELYCLVIEFPYFPHPVLFEEKLYAPVRPHLPSSDHFQSMSNCLVEIPEGSARPETIEFSVIGKLFNCSALSCFTDWEMGQENPCEDQYRKLAHHSNRGSADPSLKPNLQEKQQLERIVQLPTFADKMKSDEKDLLFKYRYYLTENKKALTKYLESVDWNIEDEVAEVPTLLALWRARAPIDISDALKLMGGTKCFQRTVVRAYAVETLRDASDGDLLVYLLQLVQALRYEPELTVGIKQADAEVTSSSVQGDAITSSANGRPLSLLATFLIQRACTSPIVANFFYWYLKVETEDDASGCMFTDVFDTFIIQISTHSEQGRQAAKQQRALDDYMKKISVCQLEAREEKGKKDAKEKKLRSLLQENIKEIPGGVDFVPMPLDPTVQICGLDPMKTIMFASAIYPAVITFFVVVDKVSAADKGPPSGEGENASAAAPPAAPVYKIIFKSGDDLRQDQLVMQVYYAEMIKIDITYDLF
jgi:phosphatidylinositol 3-kinase